MSYFRGGHNLPRKVLDKRYNVKPTFTVYLHRSRLWSVRWGNDDERTWSLTLRDTESGYRDRRRRNPVLGVERAVM